MLPSKEELTNVSWYCSCDSTSSAFTREKRSPAEPIANIKREDVPTNKGKIKGNGNLLITPKYTSVA